MRKPLVSIIIPTRNSGPFMRACLASIRNQSYGKIETIIVDQSSTDETRKIADSFNATVIVLPAPKFYSPPSGSRNVGAAAANGEILYHLDSDMELTPGLIEEIVKRFQAEPEIAALIIHEQDRPLGYWSRCKALERQCYWGNENVESARAVRRSIFDKIGGYDEEINSGEDFDIHRRYRQEGRISFCENVVIHNLGNLSFRKTISKKFNYGKTAAAYFHKHHTKGSSILKEQLGCIFRNYRKLLAMPITATGALLLKFCEFGAGGLGYAIATLSMNLKREMPNGQ